VRFYKTLLIKKYFDIGLGLTSYIKYVIAFIGLYSVGKDIDMNYTVILGVAYLFFCFILGYLWVKFELIHTENEINNIFNPFQNQVREKLEIEKFK